MGACPKSSRQMAVIPDVLRAEEDAQGEAIDKVTGGEKSSNQTHLETGLSFEEGGDVFQLAC